MQDIVVKTFNDSGCLAHLVGCAVTGEALLVDPKVGRAPLYQKALADFGLKLVAIVDTHTHADHLSDSAAYVKRDLPLHMSSRTSCARQHVALKDGDVVRVGKLKFTALDVPGHTPDSIVLHGQGLALTGDTLLVGGLARADFRGSDPAQLHEMVQKKLMKLPDATVVLPGHGYQDILFSTIGHERAKNPALKHASGAAYATALKAVEGAGNTPDVDATLALNLAADPTLPDQPVAVAACCSMGAAPLTGAKIPEMKCEELAPRRAEFAERGAWFDVRDPWELKKDGRIPGAANFPLSELGFHLGELKRSGPVVLSCRSGVRSLTAAKTLAYLGVLTEPISLAGGISRWKELGLPVA